MTEKTAKINGQTFFGESRSYVFKLMDAETGVMIFHRFASILSMSWEIIEPIWKKFRSGAGDEIEESQMITFADLLRLLPQVFTWDVIKELSAKMIAGAEIKRGDELETVEADGIVRGCPDDPLDHYLALFYAVCVNYPKYMSFLGLTPESGDSSQADGGGPAV